MTARLDRSMERAGESSRSLLACGVVAGDPYLEATPELLGVLASAGVDLVEVIFPSSDPSYHGAVIQRACQRALKEPFSLRDLLEQIELFRQEHSETPILFTVYYNQLFVPGLQQSLEAIAAAGVDAISIVDLPWREAHATRERIQAAGLAHIPSLSPTTPDTRTHEILAAQGEDITIWTGHIGGEVSDRAMALERLIEQGGLLPTAPVLASLQVSTPAEARAVAQACRGVIVASSLIWLVEGRGADLHERLGIFIGEVREALDA